MEKNLCQTEFYSSYFLLVFEIWFMKMIHPPSISVSLIVIPMAMNMKIVFFEVGHRVNWWIGSSEVFVCIYQTA